MKKRCKTKRVKVKKVKINLKSKNGMKNALKQTKENKKRLENSLKEGIKEQNKESRPDKETQVQQTKALEFLKNKNAEIPEDIEDYPQDLQVIMQDVYDQRVQENTLERIQTLKDEIEKAEKGQVDQSEEGKLEKDMTQPEKEKLKEQQETKSLLSFEMSQSQTIL